MYNELYLDEEYAAGNSPQYPEITFNGFLAAFHKTATTLRWTGKSNVRPIRWSINATAFELQTSQKRVNLQAA